MSECSWVLSEPSTQSNDKNMVQWIGSYSNVSYGQFPKLVVNLTSLNICYYHQDRNESINYPKFVRPLLEGHLSFTANFNVISVALNDRFYCINITKINAPLVFSAYREICIVVHSLHIPLLLLHSYCTALDSVNKTTCIKRF